MCTHTQGTHTEVQEDKLSMWMASCPGGILPRSSLMNQAQRRPPAWVNFFFSCFGRRRGAGTTYTLASFASALTLHPDRCRGQLLSFRSMRFEPEATCAKTIQAHLPDETSCPNSRCSLLGACPAPGCPWRVIPEGPLAHFLNNTSVRAVHSLHARRR